MKNLSEDIYGFLEAKYEQFNTNNFIENDPICIPHTFTLKQDIEISALFASLFAWGQRKTIINKCTELMKRMDCAPYQFVLQHQEKDLKNLLGFKHRTFNETDLLYFVHFLQQHYRTFESLESAFLPNVTEFRPEFMQHIVSNRRQNASNVCLASQTTFDTENALVHFKKYFTSLPYFPSRTGKHISSPLQKATCKRLNMFLRWMVRKDAQGVDFGLWNVLKSAALICPCDVHVDRVARKLGLIKRKQTDWLTALELTEELRKFDQKDPVKYDFALFGLGVEGYF